uniref:Uncharacterized protein n=1 Tax=Candidatus Kentrum sp. DK TaxID=2126562 RepID=A0A450SHQ1_9GAMM|nr:MAG: hypothetical protein BECKDK2373B_GA0170837_103939 [Candidatus Kentron sp. DK]
MTSYQQRLTETMEVDAEGQRAGYPGMPEKQKKMVDARNDPPLANS